MTFVLFTRCPHHVTGEKPVFLLFGTKKGSNCLLPHKCFKPGLMKHRKKKEGPKKNAIAQGPQRICSTDADDILDRVKTMVGPDLEARGLELVLTEFKREESGYVLRLFVDKEGGITLGDCSAVSRYAGDILDVYSEKMPAYRLEVSSPGPNRPLFTEEHFNRFAGKTVVIINKEPVNGQKKIRGVLLGASDGVVKILKDNETRDFTIQAIASARLHYQHGEDKC